MNWRDRARAAGGVFVTGTDTGVGKTVVAAILARVLGAAYWKPVQTGARDGDDDTAMVAALAELPAERLHPPAFVFAAPLSPEAAAAQEGRTPPSLPALLAARPASRSPLVVEGAGGVLVPLNGQAVMADLIAALGYPAVVVARTGLGTINHTLLTLEALRRRDATILGVALVGAPNEGNRSAIERHGAVPVLFTVPPLAPPTAAALADFIAGMSA